MSDTPRATRLEIYAAMYRSRRFDSVAVALQRQGAISGYAEARGQEATQIGVAATLQPEDMIFPSYRHAGVGMWRGVSPLQFLRLHRRLALSTWDWRAHRFAIYTTPVASQLSHAVGWARARKLDGHDDEVCVVYFGDGASSQGEAHEAMNYAGVLDVPVVFVCENNGWALSVPFERQTRAASIAARGPGYGMRSASTDGNSLESVLECAAEAVAYARSESKPVLLELRTYRLAPHTTADDPKRYRAEPVAIPDPLAQTRRTLVDAAADGEHQVSAIERQVDEELDRCVTQFLGEVEGAS